MAVKDGKKPYMNFIKNHLYGSFTDVSKTNPFAQQSNHELTHRIHLAIRCKSLYI